MQTRSEDHEVPPEQSQRSSVVAWIALSLQSLMFLGGLYQFQCDGGRFWDAIAKFALAIPRLDIGGIIRLSVFLALVNLFAVAVLIRGLCDWKRHLTTSGKVAVVAAFLLIAANSPLCVADSVVPSSPIRMPPEKRCLGPAAATAQQRNRGHAQQERIRTVGQRLIDEGQLTFEPKHSSSFNDWTASQLVQRFGEPYLNEPLNGEASPLKRVLVYRANGAMVGFYLDGRNTCQMTLTYENATHIEKILRRECEGHLTETK